MVTTYFQLDADFTDIELLRWHYTAGFGDVAIIDIPSHGCEVELRYRAAGHVLWHTRGGQRSLTVPLADALSRFQLLSWPPHERGERVDARPACVGAGMYERPVSR